MHLLYRADVSENFVNHLSIFVTQMAGHMRKWGYKTQKATEIKSAGI